MIRGVNHQTIEIKETGNPFFERAILFVTKEGSDLSEQKLKSEWDGFIRFSDRPPVSRLKSEERKRKNKKYRRIKSIVTALFWTGVGIVLSILFRCVF